MPAVAQINVNFANRLEFSSNISPTIGVPTTKSISPYSLLSYLLYNREEDNLGNEPVKTTTDLYYTYPGGFITAGDKVNVKHNDLQLIQNLDMGEGIYTDFIYSRRKDKGETYQSTRPGALRSISLAPYNEGTNLTNYIKLETAGSTKSISLFTSNANTSKLDIYNTSTRREILLDTNVITFSANNTNISGDLRVDNNVTFNKNLTIVGSNTPTTELLKVKNSAGVDKFTVDSSSGNTDIQGTLNVIGATEIEDTLRLFGAATFDSTLNINNNITLTNSLKQSKRIIGVRRVDNAGDIFDPSNSRGFQNDALAIGDFAQYAFQQGMIVMWSGQLDEDGSGRLLRPTGGWALCRGHVVDGFTTPDLRERFIVGAGPGDNSTVSGSTAYTVGTFGSNSTNVTLEISNLPKHNHIPGSNVTGQLLGNTTSTGDHTHTATAQSTFAGAQGTGSSGADTFQTGNGQPSTRANLGTPGGKVTTQVTIGGTGSHSHTIASDMDERGSGTAFDKRPPWYALAFIIKL